MKSAQILNENVQLDHGSGIKATNTIVFVMVIAI